MAHMKQKPRKLSASAVACGSCHCRDGVSGIGSISIMAGKVFPLHCLIHS